MASEIGGGSPFTNGQTFWPFRIGTTSYIIPDDILPNVRFLAGKVQDVQLILFEVDDQNNLPSTEIVNEVASVSDAAWRTFTVHLPLDLRLCAEDAVADSSVEKAKRVAGTVEVLDPGSEVLHLEGGMPLDADGNLLPQTDASWDRWRSRCIHSLEALGEAIDLERLAVENLESDPLDLLDPILEALHVSRCTDIGHLWVANHDPLPFLERALPRTRVIHIHGIDGRDHQALSHVLPHLLDPVMEALVQHPYEGSLILEIFSEEHLNTSLGALDESAERLRSRSESLL